MITEFKSNIALVLLGLIALALGIVAEWLFHWAWGSTLGLVVGVVLIAFLSSKQRRPKYTQTTQLSEIRAVMIAESVKL